MHNSHNEGRNQITHEGNNMSHQKYNRRSLHIHLVTEKEVLAEVEVAVMVKAAKED
jgi:hypothetical protein